MSALFSPPGIRVFEVVATLIMLAWGVVLLVGSLVVGDAWDISPAFGPLRAHVDEMSAATSLLALSTWQMVAIFGHAAGLIIGPVRGHMWLLLRRIGAGLHAVAWAVIAATFLVSVPSAPGAYTYLGLAIGWTWTWRELSASRMIAHIRQTLAGR